MVRITLYGSQYTVCNQLYLVIRTITIIQCIEINILSNESRRLFISHENICGDLGGAAEITAFCPHKLEPCTRRSSRFLHRHP